MTNQYHIRFTAQKTVMVSFMALMFCLSAGTSQSSAADADQSGSSPSLTAQIAAQPSRMPAAQVIKTDIPTEVKARTDKKEESTTKEKAQAAGQKVGSTVSDGINKAIVNPAKTVGSAIGKAGKNAWDATSGFVSGVFGGGSKPCDDNDAKTITDKNKCPTNKTADCNNGSLVSKTKLDKEDKCIVAKCIKGYVVSDDDKTTCIKSQGQCDDTAKSQDKNATAGELKKGKCIITECGYGYHPSDDGTKCDQAELSEEGSQQQIDDLQKNADAMREKEQSTANKTLTSATMLATAIGGQQLMEGMAEKSADEDAERDMKAYLATFACDYGQGRNTKGGDMNIELPGGNDLIAQYQEYTTLATDLKARKDALGMQPGIESEVILDKSETGLYDNAAVGKTSGAYTSVARALMDENSADAAAWAKQKADAAQKVKTGGTIAAAGAIGGLIGNLAINTGKNAQKNKANEILRDSKYQKAFEEIQAKADGIKTDKTCAGLGLSGTYPECTCTNNQFFDVEDNKCSTCASPKTFDGRNCVCPADMTTTEDGNCIAKTQCSLTGVVTDDCQCGEHTTKDGNTCKCDTASGWQAGDNTCTCPAETHVESNGRCVQKETLSIKLKADDYFRSGSAELSDNGRAFLAAMKTEMQNKNLASDIFTNFYICVVGHTDRTKYKNDSKNTKNYDLSKKRAEAVKSILESQQITSQGITAIGKGPDECDAAKYKQANDKQCRRVDIILQADPCTGDSKSSTSSTPAANDIIDPDTINATIASRRWSNSKISNTEIANINTFISSAEATYQTTITTHVDARRIIDRDDDTKTVICGVYYNMYFADLETQTTNTANAQQIIDRCKDMSQKTKLDISWTGYQQGDSQIRHNGCFYAAPFETQDPKCHAANK